jgi:hypothetical protein
MQLYLLVLTLMGLEYVDADVRAAGRLLLAAREGRALALQQWLSLPLWPGYSEESGTRFGIASVGTAPGMLASRAGHLEVVRVLFGLTPRSWRSTGKSYRLRSSSLVGRFRFASEEQWRDRAVGLEEVSQKGLALRSASKELEGDREAMQTAVQQHGRALPFASKEQSCWRKSRMLVWRFDLPPRRWRTAGRSCRPVKKAMKVAVAMKAMKDMKAMKAMKAMTSQGKTLMPMKAMKAKRVSKNAKSPLAKAMALRGSTAKTSVDLTMYGIFKNKRGKVVSKRVSKIAKGRLAKSVVRMGPKAKTSGGLTKDAKAAKAGMAMKAAKAGMATKVAKKAAKAGMATKAAKAGMATKAMKAARGRLAKPMVLRGSGAKTSGGLNKDAMKAARAGKAAGA